MPDLYGNYTEEELAGLRGQGGLRQSSAPVIPGALKAPRQQLPRRGKGQLFLGNFPSAHPQSVQAQPQGMSPVIPAQAAPAKPTTGRWVNTPAGRVWLNPGETLTKIAGRPVMLLPGSTDTYVYAGGATTGGSGRRVNTPAGVMVLGPGETLTKIGGRPVAPLLGDPDTYVYV